VAGQQDPPPLMITTSFCATATQKEVVITIARPWQ
jgi:hypothetical protein